MSLFISMDGERLLSRNQLDTKHWSARHKLSKRIKSDLFILSHGQRPREPFQRAAVSITSFRPRLLDPDNLVGGCKPYIDALKTNGIITDDKPENVTLSIRQVKISKAFRVEITVEPIVAK